MHDPVTIGNIVLQTLIVLGGAGYGVNALHSRFSPSRRAKSNGNNIVAQVAATISQATIETKEGFYKALRELVVKRQDEQTAILRDNNKMLGEFLAGENVRRQEELKRLFERKGGSE